MKKNKTNIEIYEQAAKNLGITTELVQSSPSTHSLLITYKEKFYLASASTPGFYPEVRRWNAHFSSSKLLTQKILKRFGYKVVSSEAIRHADFSSLHQLDAKLRQLDLKYPILIKPDMGLRGQGIALADTLVQLKKIAKEKFQRGEDFMLQPILNQNEYRILIVNYEVVLMHSKQNPHIVGDGVSTIAQLLSEIKKSKKDETFIKYEHKLHKTKASSVLKKGTFFEYHLTKKPTSDYYQTSQIPAVIKKWTLKLAKTINAPVIGIDVFIPGTFADTSTYTIIELNSNPGLNYLPTYCNDETTAINIFEKVLRDYFGIKK